MGQASLGGRDVHSVRAEFGSVATIAAAALGKPARARACRPHHRSRRANGDPGLRRWQHGREHRRIPFGARRNGSFARHRGCRARNWRPKSLHAQRRSRAAFRVPVGCVADRRRCPADDCRTGSDCSAAMGEARRSRKGPSPYNSSSNSGLINDRRTPRCCSDSRLACLVRVRAAAWWGQEYVVAGLRGVLGVPSGAAPFFGWRDQPACPEKPKAWAGRRPSAGNRIPYDERRA